MTAQEKLSAYFSKLIPIGEQEQTYINNAFELMSFVKKEFLLKRVRFPVMNTSLSKAVSGPTSRMNKVKSIPYHSALKTGGVVI